MTKQQKQLLAEILASTHSESLEDLQKYIQNTAADNMSMSNTIRILHAAVGTDDVPTLIHEVEHLKTIATEQSKQLTAVAALYGRTDLPMVEVVKELVKSRKHLSEIVEVLGVNAPAKCVAKIKQLAQAAWAPVDAEIDRLKENTMLLEHLLISTGCATTMDLVSEFKARVPKAELKHTECVLNAADYELARSQAKALHEVLQYTGCVDVKTLCKQHNHYKSLANQMQELATRVNLAGPEYIPSEFLRLKTKALATDAALESVDIINLDVLTAEYHRLKERVSLLDHVLESTGCADTMELIGSYKARTPTMAAVTMSTAVFGQAGERYTGTEEAGDQCEGTEVINESVPAGHFAATTYNTLAEVRKILGLTPGDNVLTRLKQLVDVYVEATEFLVGNRVRTFDKVQRLLNDLNEARATLHIGVRAPLQPFISLLRTQDVAVKQLLESTGFTTIDQLREHLKTTAPHQSAERFINLLATERQLKAFLAAERFESLEHARSALAQFAPLATLVKEFTALHECGQLSEVTDLISQLRRRLAVEHDKASHIRTTQTSVALSELVVSGMADQLSKNRPAMGALFHVPIVVEHGGGEIKSVVYLSSNAARLQAAADVHVAAAHHLGDICSRLGVSSYADAQDAITNLQHHNAQGAKALTAAINLITSEIDYCYHHATAARVKNDVARSGRHLERGDRLRNGLNDIKGLVK